MNPLSIWLVNPFDPLPGDPEQEGRYATLARMLAARGHCLTWWTSSFSHRFKRPVDQAGLRATCDSLGISIRFLEAPAYDRNISIARLWNHRMLIRRLAQAAAKESPPDVVLASSPTPGQAAEAIAIGRRRGSKTVLDVQDLWPETFRRLAPAALRPALDLLLLPMGAAARRAYAQADFVVGVADEYVNRAMLERPSGAAGITIPLGVDLAEFDAAAAKGKCPEFTKPQGEVWLAYTGSLSHSYDWQTILKAAARLRDTAAKPLRFFVTGRGDLQSQARGMAAELGLPNVTLTSFMDFPAWAYLLSQCDIAFNASFPDAMIYLPNKIFYYMAAGAAVLNTIPGQCSRIVRDGRCGLDYAAGDDAACAAAANSLISDGHALADMRQASRRLSEQVYDRKVLYRQYVDLIERLAQSP